MKRIVLLFAVILFANISFAQNPVHFKLTPNGTFLSEDDQTYVIIEISGKSAEELYSSIKSNVLQFYKSPKDVLSENEPTNMSIRALSDVLYSGYKLPGGFMSYRAYYNLVFHFKDGRIKVDAPIIDQRLDVQALGAALGKTFKGFVDDWFDKKGRPKSKNVDEINKIEDIFNGIINELLGLKVKIQKEEDW